MDTFDDIRPYRDAEIVEKLRAVIDDPALVAAASTFLFPKLDRYARGLTRFAIRELVKLRARSIRSADDLHTVMARWLEKLIRHTTAGVSFVGIERLGKRQPYLFVSNHRDIVLDPAFVNYALFKTDRTMAEIAVGDNLLQFGFETELMRLNRCFMVVRSASSLREQYEALRHCSNYIRKTLETGESVWIAQREGRPKDSMDVTDPAIIKMLMLAYRDETRDVSEWLRCVPLVPLALSYELDPCAPRKAHELYRVHRDGAYSKRPGEDLRSIVRGLLGYKGRVTVSFGERISGTFGDVDDLARAIDRSIRAGMEVFPTYGYARRLLTSDGSVVQLPDRVWKEFHKQAVSITEEEWPFFLAQYANQFVE